MSSWASRAKISLAPLSLEKREFSLILTEWRYNGVAIDLDEPCESCRLCGHQGIRFQFGIENIHTSEELLVGSECITKFEISGIGECGEFLDPDRTRAKLGRDRSKLIKEAKVKRVLNCLLLLDSKDDEFNFESTIQKFQERRALSPNHVAMIFWRLKKNKISFNPRDFKISIRRGRELDQLRLMEDWKIKTIYEALSPSQKLKLNSVSFDNNSRSNYGF